MRRAAWIAVWTLLALVAAYAAWPFVGLVQIGQALQAADIDGALRHIDVQSVRRSIVGQVLDEGIAQANIQVTMNDAARRLVVDTAMARLDKAAADVLTPETLLRLIREGEFATASSPGVVAAAPGQSAADDRMLPDNPLRYLQSWRLSSPVTFRVVVGEENAPDEWTGLTLRREGLTWRLTQVRLPEAVMARIRPAIRAEIEKFQ